MLIEKFLESDNIKRFWTLPLIFSLFLFHSQLFDLLIGMIKMRFDPPTDLYMHDTYFVAVYVYFLSYILVGTVAGLCFAALDFRKNKSNDQSGNEATASTIRNLIPSGALSWLTWLILKGTFVYGMASWSMHRRYHAYPPEMQFLNIFARIFPLLLALALLWTVFKTLNRYKTRAH